VDWIDDAPAIRKALTTKHHEYGDLEGAVRLSLAAAGNCSMRHQSPVTLAPTS
jgi:hypothetical protein